jgi:hypothetical protein
VRHCLKKKNKYASGQVWWLKTVIAVIQEAEIGRISVKLQFSNYGNTCTFIMFLPLNILQFIENQLNMCFRFIFQHSLSLISI